MARAAANYPPRPACPPFECTRARGVTSGEGGPGLTGEDRESQATRDKQRAAPHLSHPPSPRPGQREEAIAGTESNAGTMRTDSERHRHTDPVEKRAPCRVRACVHTGTRTRVCTQAHAHMSARRHTHTCVFSTHGRTILTRTTGQGHSAEPLSSRQRIEG